MRTLTADDLARVRAARARRTTWERLARELTADDRAAGLLGPGECWTGPTLRYVVEHPAPVRVVRAGGAR